MPDTKIMRAMHGLELKLGKNTFIYLYFSVIVATLLLYFGSSVLIREYTWQKVPAVIISQRSYKTAKSGTRYAVALRASINNEKIIVNAKTGDGPYKLGSRTFVYYDRHNYKTMFFDDNNVNTKVLLTLLAIWDGFIIFIIYEFSRYRKTIKKHVEQ